MRVSFCVEWDEIGRTRAVEVRPLITEPAEGEAGAGGGEMRRLAEAEEGAAGRLKV